jgi:hypothetical protein
MTNWVFLSKDGTDEYINKFAKGCKSPVVSTEDFAYEDSTDPIILRGILKHKIMTKNNIQNHQVNLGQFIHLPKLQNDLHVKSKNYLK